MKTRLSGRTVVLFVTLVVVMLWSCGNDPEKTHRIVTANNEVIKLEPGEKNPDNNNLDKITADKYQRYFGSVAGFQAPLNKVIYGHSCTFFYGLPLNTDVLKLYGVFSAAYNSKVIATGILPDTTEGKLLVKDSLNYILVEVIKTANNNLLLGGAVSKDSSMMMGYYLGSNLRTRIQNEKKD